MNKVFNFLFQFLKKENIEIDESEFLFQMQSHPDFPSLLTISDTLTFFNIENEAFRLDFSEIELLPNNFITTLKEDKSRPRLYYVEKKNGIFLIFSDNKAVQISKSDLQKRWTNIVMTINNSKYEKISKSKKDFSFILLSLCLGLCFVSISQFKTDLFTKLFFIFPMLGVFFSLAVLKDLLGVKSELINNLCNITISSSCNEVINSNKWKIFKYINFSDLSLVFFTAQISTFFVLTYASNQDSFFSIQFLLLYCSFPFIFISLFYQKFIQKSGVQFVSCLLLFSALSFYIF